MSLDKEEFFQKQLEECRELERQAITGRTEPFGNKPLIVGKSSFGRPKLNHATVLGIRSEGALLTMRTPTP